MYRIYYYIDEHAEKYSIIIAELAEYRSRVGIWENSFILNCVLTLEPLAWWKGVYSFSKLLKIADKILSSPVTSAATERSFSIYSIIHTKKRNKLKTEQASKVSFQLFGLSFIIPAHFFD